MTETFTFAEVQGLRKRGFDVTVYSFRKPNPHEIHQEMSMELETTSYFPSLKSIKILSAQLKRFWKNPIDYLSLLWKVFTEKYKSENTLYLKIRSLCDFLRGVYLAELLPNNTLHIHAQFGGNAATSAWVCSQFTGINFSFRSHTGFNPQMLNLKIKDASFVITISKFDKSQLLNHSQPKYSGKIWVNYLGVNVERWNANHSEIKESLIVSVGRLTEKKGYEYLLKAARILNDRGKDFKVKIAGDGSLKKPLENLIGQYKLQNRVDLLGYIRTEQVQKLIDEASIFCLPSVIASNHDVDGIPVVLMEAMALEKPCVSTSISGIPELITDGVHGILVPEKNSLILANALERLLESADLREQLGKAAREKIKEDFNANTNLDKLAEELRKAVLRNH